MTSPVELFTSAILSSLDVYEIASPSTLQVAVGAVNTSSYAMLKVVVLNDSVGVVLVVGVPPSKIISAFVVVKF